MGINNIPKISVIVPVYNGEFFLHRCIDSLIYQTLNDIEILIVDNQSTDNTWEIMQLYQEEFPEKVRIFELGEHTDGPGAGRNIGLKNARADYIGFADADDYFEYNAFELMYSMALREKCDLIYIPSYDVKGTDFIVTRTLPTGSREEILTIGSMVFWNKLVHKSLFDIVGKIPEDMVFEDLAYCPALVSYAKKIGYIDKPLYYYIIRDDSGVNTMEPDRVLKSIEAETIALSLCNTDYIDYFATSVAMRNCNNIRDRWQFADSYIEQLRKIKPFLDENNFFKKDKRNYKRVQTYYHLSHLPMPEIIYVNGFFDIDRDFYEMVKSKAFLGDIQIIKIEKAMCDFEDPLECYLFSNQKFEILSKYIALKLIQKKGGIYLESCIQLEAPLNYLRYFNMFFAYIDNYSFSDSIFGGISGNKILPVLINEIKSKYDRRETFAENIKNVLRIHFNIPIDGKTHLYEYDATVFSKYVFAYNDGAKLHLTSHDFKNRVDNEEYITVKRSTLIK